MEIKIDWLEEATILDRFVDPVCEELTVILATTEQRKLEKHKTIKALNKSGSVAR